MLYKSIYCYKTRDEKCSQDFCFYFLYSYTVTIMHNREQSPLAEREFHFYELLAFSLNILNGYIVLLIKVLKKCR